MRHIELVLVHTQVLVRKQGLEDNLEHHTELGLEDNLERRKELGHHKEQEQEDIQVEEDSHQELRKEQGQEGNQVEEDTSYS